MSTLDCGDNSCEFAKVKTGMRTNGGCRCLKDLDFSRRMAVRRYLVALREENARLTRERDKAEAKLARVVEILSNPDGLDTRWETMQKALAAAKGE